MEDSITPTTAGVPGFWDLHHPTVAIAAFAVLFTVFLFGAGIKQLLTGKTSLAFYQKAHAASGDSISCPN